MHISLQKIVSYVADHIYVYLNINSSQLDHKAMQQDFSNLEGLDLL